MHLYQVAGQNYTLARSSFCYYGKHLAFWQITCCFHQNATQLLDAGGAEWPDTSKEIGANCVLR